MADMIQVWFHDVDVEKAKRITNLLLKEEGLSFEIAPMEEEKMLKKEHVISVGEDRDVEFLFFDNEGEDVNSSLEEFITQFK